MENERPVTSVVVNFETQSAQIWYNRQKVSCIYTQLASEDEEFSKLLKELHEKCERIVQHIG